MRVLVTGGAGFIGSHLIDAILAAGHEAAALDDLSSGSPDNLPSGVPLFQVDVRDAGAVLKAVTEYKPDAIAHQAAQMSVSRSVREPRFDAEVNVVGLINTLDAAVATGARRFVFASSGGVMYGDVHTPAPEETPADPISPYGIAKMVGERYLNFYAREHGLTCTALRYANVYGPRQNPHGEAGVVAIFCTKMLQGQAGTINGDGRYVRDYVYVTDVADANLRALTVEGPSSFSVFNVGTSIPTDVNQLCAALEMACSEALMRHGRNSAVPPAGHGPARAGDLRSSLVAYDSIQKQLGWSPRMPLDHGIAETVEWFAKKLLK
ncbi:UDP-glucose 4-epimerase [Caulifigura coniformis]|uniref:UDP-glucose 4-epimerase n=1 Tax=Caulifigura coniformis TaxID=2527983 RepID=A0A517SJR9_9PLAN|nr:NAD-dependent epimerase/dehydratase family protein [Caulifigura coniformis]QDT56365.1 UDP-glucose 4-epimerase [Caulifigura coniformis]